MTTLKPVKSDRKRPALDTTLGLLGMALMFLGLLGYAHNGDTITTLTATLILLGTTLCGAGCILSTYASDEASE